LIDIDSNQTTGDISIGNNADITGNINIGTLTTGTHAINIGNASSFQTVNINRPLTCNSITTNNNTIFAGTTGDISIGNNADRTGNINIGTLTTGTHAINIGNASSFQTVNINRPLTCNSITTNNNMIFVGTGSITGGGLTILDGTFATVSSITTAGDITGKSLTTTSNIATSATMKTPIVNSPSLTTDLNIAPDQTTGNINIGNSVIVGVSQVLTVRRPITIGWLPSDQYGILCIGGSPNITSFGFTSVSTATKKQLEP
jgi:hypothetical protein